MDQIQKFVENLVETIVNKNIVSLYDCNTDK